MTRPLLRIFAGIFATAALFFVLSCAHKQASDTDIVATWGDTTMNVKSFKDWMYVRYRNEAGASKEPYKSRMDILDEYVTRDCKLLEGRRLGFDKREDIQKEYQNALQQKAVDLLYNDKVRDRMFTEQQIQDYFEHDGVEVRVRHLLISMPDSIKGRDTVQYWQKISDVYQKVKAGQDFIKLIDQYSEDKSVDPAAHGDLGFFRWGRMVDEFQDAAWKLNPGEISPIIKTRYGYHIIQLIDKRPTNLEYNTSNILVKVNRKDSPAETTLAFERAKQILAEAKKSGADFSALARKYSEDEKTWLDGEVGWVPKGTMPTEYWDKVYTMKIGDVDGPVRTYKGYHIIKLKEKRQAPRSLDDPAVRNDVLSSLERVYRGEMKEVADRYMDSVKQSFGMRYDPNTVSMLLKKLGDKSIPQNMNQFSSLTPEERDMLVIHDNLGGVKVSELIDMYGDHRFPVQFRNDPKFIEELADPLLMPKYLGEFAKKEHYYERPEAIADGKRALDNAMLPEVEKEMVFNKATPSDDDLKKFYNDNINKYTQAETRTGFEILVDDKTLAGDLLGRIKKGEDISALARRYTMRTKVKGFGGKLGPFAQAEYGPVSQKAFTMGIGDLAGPIDVDGKTWSIFKLTEVAPAKTQTFDEARRQLESEYRFSQQKVIQDKWIADLKKAYDVKYYEDVIKRVWPIVEPLPESMVAERKKWKDDRADLAKKQMVENQIKLKLQPGSTQKFVTKEGKQVEVQIGQPRYVDKSGKEISPDKSKVRLSPQGRLESKNGANVQGGAAPVIKLKPKSSGN